MGSCTPKTCSHNGALRKQTERFSKIKCWKKSEKNKEHAAHSTAELPTWDSLVFAGVLLGVPKLGLLCYCGVMGLKNRINDNSLNICSTNRLASFG